MVTHIGRIWAPFYNLEMKRVSLGFVENEIVYGLVEVYVLVGNEYSLSKWNSLSIKQDSWIGDVCFVRCCRMMGRHGHNPGNFYLYKT